MAEQPMAVVGRITSITPIEGADRIVQAQVVCGASGKWSGVVGKDIAEGDLVTVFLQDALLPPSDRWAFMERSHWRVRMARFKGVPSECLIIAGAPDLPPGTDLSKELGVTKYEKPVPESMRGEAAGAFPSFIPKTDEANFQTVENWQDLLAKGNWYASEKADGTSCTAWVDESGLHVCSRNWELREFDASGKTNSYWRVARQYGLDRLPKGVALQFEIIGPGIQKNPMGLSDLQARAFSLYNIRQQRYEPLHRLQELCASLEIPAAKVIITSADLSMAPSTDENLRTMAEITYSNRKPAEGIVIRDQNSTWSFKVINLLYKD